MIKNAIRRVSEKRSQLTIYRASQEELLAHKEKLSKINLDSNGECLWLKRKN
jgi:tRNA threonylcarbamoyladenosine modification (KEOPS) complex  Pcc1 subunit